jgi:hypothetical protein
MIMVLCPSGFAQCDSSKPHRLRFVIAHDPEPLDREVYEPIALCIKTADEDDLKLGPVDAVEKERGLRFNIQSTSIGGVRDCLMRLA